MVLPVLQETNGESYRNLQGGILEREEQPRRAEDALSGVMNVDLPMFGFCFSVCPCKSL